MLHTRTGSFPIGFRRIRRAVWQQDLETLHTFVQQEGFGFIDLLDDADTQASECLAKDVAVCSVDLPDPAGIASPDPETRAKAIERAGAYIRACSKIGLHRFFLVVRPGDPAMSRQEAFDAAVEGYRELYPVLEETDTWLVIEGFPPGLVTNPESYREFRKRVGDRAAVNYDPSHLIRMDVDPIRFLKEFAPYVHHVHGKDTEILTENLYEIGRDCASVTGVSHRFGGAFWRYTVPGHGVMRWTEALKILRDSGYKGGISIELEDEQFNGSEDGERLGLRLAGRYLAGC
jgi:sugar phosphate isomerase/epimerase